jgi:hypothetical protein
MMNQNFGPFTPDVRKHLVEEAKTRVFHFIKGLADRPDELAQYCGNMGDLGSWSLQESLPRRAVGMRLVTCGPEIEVEVETVPYHPGNGWGGGRETAVLGWFDGTYITMDIEEHGEEAARRRALEDVVDAIREAKTFDGIDGWFVREEDDISEVIDKLMEG